MTHSHRGLTPYRFAGGTAVVTGAAGGIGAALATGLAHRGSSLVLLDRNPDGLDDVARRLRDRHPGISVATEVVDLADDAATTAVARRVRAAHPETTLLLNNAGVALGGTFEQMSVEEFCWVLDVNLRATVRMTSELLPVLRTHHGAHVVNTSSLFGLVAPAGQTAYAASKFAVRGFSEALRTELLPLGIGVTCVHPGGVATDIARTVRLAHGVDPEQAQVVQESFQRLLRTSPATAAHLVLEGVERRRPRVLIGSDAKALDVLARVLPASYSSLLVRSERLLARRGPRRQEGRTGVVRRARG